MHRSASVAPSAASGQSFQNQPVLDMLPDPAAFFDCDLKCTYANAAMAAAVGMSPTEVIGCSLYDECLAAVAQPILLQAIQACLEQGAVQTVVLAVTRVDSSPQVLHIRVAPAMHAGGGLRGLMILGRDVTDLSVSRAALQEANLQLERRIAERTGELEAANRELRFKARLLDVAGEAIVVSDLVGNITYFNPAAEHMFGWRAHEVLGRNVSEVLVMDFSQEQATQIMESLNRGESWSGAFPLLRRDGSQLIGIVTDTPFFDDQGQLAGIIGITVDISQRVAAEQEVERTAQQLKRVLEGTDDGFWDFDGLTQQIVLSARAAEILDFGADQYVLPIASWFDHIHPDDRARTLEQLQAHFEGRSANFDMEYRLIRPDGACHWVRNRGRVAERDQQGKVLRAAGTISDVDRRKRAELDLQASEQRYRDLVENSLQGVCILIDGRVVFATPSLESITGYTPAETLAMSADETLAMVVPEDQAQFLDRVLSIKGGQAYESADLVRFVHKSGEIRCLLYSVARTIYEGREAIQLTSLDITPRIQAEDALRKSHAELIRAYDALQQASRAKDDFLASMSHELRTPLTAILVLSDVLREQIYGPLNERQTKYLETIHGSGQHLLTLINDILDLSKFQRGAENLVLEPTNVRDICLNSLTMVRPTADEKQLQLRYSQQPDDIMLTVDGRRLKQMLLNLLSNAVKFTPANGQVGMDVMGDKEAGMVRFTVWDTGIGIAAEDIAKLFTPFVQLDSSLSRQYPGTGLGLALVKRLAQMHGGDVSVQSTQGMGSRFTLWLPWRSST